MDAFYASVEQRDFPELRGKAIAVGSASGRGVVATCSYEARKYGVRSAMPSQIAIKKCPHLIFVDTRFGVYKEVSQKIREIFHRYTDLVEPLSMDEAYLDVSENKMQMRSATLIAEQIRKDIYAETQLTASAGVSYNKFLAKVASDMNKPNGQFVITPKEGIAFLEELPIEKFHGIGKVTASKMKAMNIHKGADLKKSSEIDLILKFGKAGRHYFRIVRGDDQRPVRPNRVRKSIGIEDTFSEDLTSEAQMKDEISRLITGLIPRIDRSKAKGRTITLKLKDSDFNVNTRSKSLAYFTEDAVEIQQIAYELLMQDLPSEPIRLLGVSLSNLHFMSDEELGYQLTIEF